MSTATIPFPHRPHGPVDVPSDTSQSRRNLQRLVRYLIACGGEDLQQFVDQEGRPDIFAARAFAEGMRAQLSEALDRLVGVEQSYHRVTLRYVPPDFANML